MVDTPVDPDSMSYAMDSRLRGKVLIFNQMTFADVNFSRRLGSERDVERLLETLPRLGFAMEHIRVLEDSTALEINSVAKNMCNDRSLRQYDCLMVVFLTNGMENDQLMARDTSFYLYDFIEYFTPAKLPAMAGKPKMFIVQACRGGKIDQGVELRKTVSSWTSCTWRASSSSTFSVSSDVIACSQLAEDAVSDPLEQQHSFSYPEFADFIIAMSSHSGM